MSWIRALLLSLFLLPSVLLAATTTTPLTFSQQQSCYTVWAGPSTGTYPTDLAIPSFRRLVTADLVLVSLGVPNGGTGKTTLTAYALMAGGTSSTGAMQQVFGVGSSGQLLQSGGSGVLPAWTNPTFGVSSGGTGLTTASTYAIICGGTTGTGVFQQVSGLGTSGQFLTSAGAGALPTWSSGSVSNLVIQTGSPYNTLVGLTGATTSGAQANTFIGYHAGNAAATNGFNVGIGKDALLLNANSSYCTAIGWQSLGALTSGDSNTAIGRFSMVSADSCNNNTALGEDSLSQCAGDGNTGIGLQALTSLGAGSSNTSVGFQSLKNNSTGSGNVAFGYRAGLYETGSNAFYVNNQDRTDTAGDKAKSLIYGTFNSTASSQTLAVNASLTVNPGSITLKGSSSGTCVLSVPSAAGTGTIFTLPSSNGTSGYVLSTNGSGVTSWVAQSGGGGVSLPFRLGTATTADTLADSLFATSAATQKALVLQADPAQTANVFEIQQSSGTAGFYVDYSGACTSSLFTGNGAGLNNIADSALSANVPLLNRATQTFTGINTFGPAGGGTSTKASLLPPMLTSLNTYDTSGTPSINKWCFFDNASSFAAGIGFSPSSYDLINGSTGDFNFWSGCTAQDGTNASKVCTIDASGNLRGVGATVLNYLTYEGVSSETLTIGGNSESGLGIALETDFQGHGITMNGGNIDMSNGLVTNVDTFGGITAALSYVTVSDTGAPSTPGGGGIFYSDSGHPSAMGTAGIGTPLAPHVEDGPSALYDNAPGIDEVVKHVSYYTGTIEWLNRSRMARKLDGETIPGKCRIVETFADYNTRTGAKLAVRDWDTDQAKAVASSVGALAEQVKRKLRIDADHAKWAAMKPAQRAKMPEPAFKEKPLTTATAKPKPLFLTAKTKEVVAPQSLLEVPEKQAAPELIFGLIGIFYGLVVLLIFFFRKKK